MIQQVIHEFFERVRSDPRVTINHIGIYLVLLELWTARGNEYPMYLFSREAMSVAKISTRYTYHRLLRDLADFGYIGYEASFKRTRGSKIYISQIIEEDESSG